MLEVLEGEEKQEQLPRLFALSAGDQPEFVQEAMPYQLIALLTLVMLYGQGSTVLTGREKGSVEMKKKVLHTERFF